MSWTSRRAVTLARSRIGSAGLAFALRYVAAALPVDRLYTDRATVAFRHPLPFWETHVVAVPRRRIRSFTAIDFDSPGDRDTVISILRILQRIGAERRLAPYTVHVNGGAYQEMPLLHFHLGSGAAADGSVWGAERWEAPADGAKVVRQGSAVGYRHPRPSRAFHYLISSPAPLPPFSGIDLADIGYRGNIVEALSLAQHLIAHHSLPAYALLLNGDQQPPEEQISFHLLAGPRT